MKSYLRLTFLLLIFFPVLIVSGHTPLDTVGVHNTPESALLIDDPTKSWTLYEEVEDVNYYLVHLHEGEELRVSLYVSIWGESHFTPNLVVMGPDVVGSDEPPFIHPEDLGRVIIEGIRDYSPQYEPFTPASYIYVASFSQVASSDADYYLAVYGENHVGKYGMALGYRETFTLVEWFKIPLDLVGIHIWEGQPLLLLFGPPGLVLIIGVYLLFINVSRGQELPLTIQKLGGLIYFSSGVMTLTQMVVYLFASGPSGSALLTFFFISAQLGMGCYLVRDTPRMTSTLLAASVGGVLFWAGWIVGPVLVMSSGVVRSRLVS